MTVATYSTNLADIYAGAGSISGWSALGGGASGLNAETDFFIQGTGCTSKNAFASTEKGMIYNNGSDAGGSGTDGAYLMWITHLTPNSVNTIAAGGISMVIGSGTGDYLEYYVGGRDTIEFGGWILAAVNEADPGDKTTGSPSATVESHFGALFDLPSGGPTKGAPNAVDAIRFGRCDIVILNGTGADPEATFDGIITNLETATNRYGLLVRKDGAYYNSGLLQFGSAGTAVEFSDANKTIFLRDHPHVTANFHTWEVQNASSVISLTSISAKALGTTSRGRWITTDDATVTLTSCSFIDWGTFEFDSNTTVDACTFLGCKQITPNGADMAGSSFLLSDVSADQAAVYETRSTAAETDLVEYTGCTFSQGPAAHHAIRFSSTVDENLTLTDCAFNGFDSTANANGSTFRFDATTGSLNLTLNNCTVDGSPASAANIGIDDAAGISVTVITGAVAVQATAALKDGTPVENARVYLKASNGTGPFPFEETVTITRSGTTATVSHTAHGMATNDKIVLEGITDKVEDNFKIFQITVLTANSYTYQTTASGSTSYTGTILSTFVALSGLTNASGILSTSRVYPTNQPIVGWTRKSTSTPFLQEGVLVGTVNSNTGFAGTAVMLADE